MTLIMLGFDICRHDCYQPIQNEQVSVSLAQYLVPEMVAFRASGPTTPRRYYTIEQRAHEFI